MTKKNQSSASVVDGKLILSFPHAISPIVWQMELGEAKASALEVQENKDEGNFSLTLKTPRGESVSIAAFQSRDDAVSGLMAASQALENAHGQIRPGGKGSAQDNSPAPSAAAQTAPKRGGSRWPGVVIGIVFIIVLIGIWSSLTPRPPSGFGAASSITSSASPDAAGVPVSADDFLRGR